MAGRLLEQLAPKDAVPALRQDAARVRARLAARERELIALLESDWPAFERKRPYWRLHGVRRGRR